MLRSEATKNLTIHKQAFRYVGREILRFAQNDRSIILTEADHYVV